MLSMITAISMSILGSLLLSTILSGIPLFIAILCWGFISGELADKITD